MHGPTSTGALDEMLAEARWVRRLAQRLAGAGLDADDLTQQTWEAALDQTQAARGPMRGWLAGVMRNLARMELRTARRRARREREVGAACMGGQAEASGDLLARVDAHRLVADLVRALDEPFRSTLLLRYFEDLAPIEIARREGIPPGTVRWRLQRGLDLLRARLDARFEGDRARWQALLAPALGAGAAARPGADARPLPSAPPPAGSGAALGPAAAPLAVARLRAGPAAAPGRAPALRIAVGAAVGAAAITGGGVALLRRAPAPPEAPPAAAVFPAPTPQTRDQETEMRQIARALTALTIGAAAPSMIALPAAAGDAPAAAAPRNPEVLRRVRAPLGPGPIRGPADAKVTVLAFVDYQCPFSAKAEATIDELVARHPRDLRVQLVPRPLPTHAHADLAARAAIAAGLQGKRWEMHRALFAEQRALGPALVQQQATRLGLDLARFRSDLDGKVVRDELDGEIARARRLGVGSTPTFLLNGRFVTGAHPVEALSALVAEEIGYADEILARGVPAARLYEVILANVPEPNAGDLVVRDRGSAALAKCAPTPEAQEALRGLRIEADGTQRWPQPPSAAQAKLGACLVAELRGAPLVLRPAGEAPRDLPRNLDFAEGAAADPRAAAVPPGWGVTGSAPNDFHFGVERSGGAEGKPALVVRAAAPAPRGFGALVQNVKPGRYAGRRVRLSAQMRTAGVERWTGLWMRVDPNLAFDNMFKRPLKGTTGWARQEIVLDVPVAAKNLAIGVLVNGPGEVRVSDVRLEVVGEEVPVTATPGDLAELFAK